MSPTRPGRWSFPCQLAVKESTISRSPALTFLTAMRTGQAPPNVRRLFFPHHLRLLALSSAVRAAIRAYLRSDVLVPSGTPWGGAFFGPSGRFFCFALMFVGPSLMPTFSSRRRALARADWQSSVFVNRQAGSSLFLLWFFCSSLDSLDAYLRRISRRPCFHLFSS